MKRLLLVVALAGSLGTFVPSAQATILWYEFSFTGADLMGYSFVDGADNTTAAQNGLFHGARFSREISQPVVNKRTYIWTEHGLFTDWVQDAMNESPPVRLTTFNIWGFEGGKSARWGEDYKHMNQLSVSTPDGWDTEEELPDFGEGSSPNDNLSARALHWNADAEKGLRFDDEDLAEKEFVFQLQFDSEDWLYGGETYGAPNTLGGSVTFWFGGLIQNDAEAAPYIYEGNMVLTGREIPEPTSLLLIGLGLAGFGIRRLRRRK